MNNNGTILVICLLVMTILSLLGLSALATSLTDDRVNKSFISHKKTFYIAEAGIEHARDKLREEVQTQGFSSYLLNVSGKDRLLQGNIQGSDDKPFLDTDFAKGHYTVYLTNDVIEGETNQTDRNKKIILRSLGIEKNGEQMELEAVINIPLARVLNELPATITIIGKGSTFLENPVHPHIFSGNDSPECGVISKPVFGVFDTQSLKNIKAAIDSSASEYETHDIGGPLQIISDLFRFEVERDFGINFSDIDDLNLVLRSIEKGAHLIIPIKRNSEGLDMGTPKNPKIVVAKRDFELRTDGYGVLVVEGKLTVQKRIKYEGLIIVVGEGELRIRGQGKIIGGILIANTHHPVLNNDFNFMEPVKEPGSGILDMPDSINFTVSNCSKSVRNVLSAIPFPLSNFCDERCISIRKET